MKPSKLRSDLKKYMAVHGLSATDVASRTHLSVSSVSRFISGEIEEPHQVAQDAYRRLLADEQKPEGARA